MLFSDSTWTPVEGDCCSVEAFFISSSVSKVVLSDFWLSVLGTAICFFFSLILAANLNVSKWYA